MVTSSRDAVNEIPRSDRTRADREQPAFPVFESLPKPESSAAHCRTGCGQPDADLVSVLQRAAT